MSNQEIVRLGKKELTDLMIRKFRLAGLCEDHARQVAEHLAYADSVGAHSHGAVRVEYYAERISKGGSTINPDIVITETGPATAVIDGDNAVGFVVANIGMKKAIDMARKNGVAMVGMKRLGHCGTLSYYLRQAAEKGFLALSLCQSDPMAVPFGGAGVFFGTNPIGFACPVENGPPIVIDMATTVQAWGKVLDARAKKKKIPDTWAVDKNGEPTADPFAVCGLSPIAGAKGYGLMMMVDILSGSLLGVPYGPHVSSMYQGLDQGRGLGQLHVVINPAFFGDSARFAEAISGMVGELHGVRPASGATEVTYPGERSLHREKDHQRNGIPIVKEIYDYLLSDAVYINTYELGNPFASREQGRTETC